MGGAALEGRHAQGEDDLLVGSGLRRAVDGLRALILRYPWRYGHNFPPTKMSLTCQAKY